MTPVATEVPCEVHKAEIEALKDRLSHLERIEERLDKIERSLNRLLGGIAVASFLLGLAGGGVLDWLVH